MAALDRVLPILAFAALIVSWIYHPTAALVLAVLTILLIGSIIASVHHAEVIAQKVGEPFGSLVLAVAVTVIEVGLILTLMPPARARPRWPVTPSSPR